jgi:2-dehydro-3-deoxy-D-gluconate 5-dehydrogenase
VTGASRGIGRAIAVELARRGYDLALVQRSDAAETVAEVGALGRRALVVGADLEKAEAGAAAVSQAAESLGRLDVLVANAGVIQRQPALDVSLADFRRVLEINLVAAFALSQAAARIFIESGGGCIVHVASVLSFQGGIRVAAYAASKGGLAQLTRALANEWAARGIRVNAVAPGYVENEQTAPLRADPVRKRQIDERIPAGRWATEEDIADAVAYLASPAARYVHGHVLVVDGGWLAR